ncbi:Mediator of RNA polymerase II transcription subunit 27 [Plasmodiophora brassicae]|uniref:Mediator of RNA polymerase II transcription subunit 27 n=1 Tax=Plasmodiophora brassicae TaxID=37360 RepID=A0A0G4J197_PLABS|nr:hypothetical protein PBRA_001878 [Plasmodiophora brassicae]
MDVDAIRADQESIAAAIDAIVGLRLAVMDVLESWRNTFLDGTGTFAAVVKQRRAALDAALAAFKEAIAGIKDTIVISPDFPGPVSLSRVVLKFATISAEIPIAVCDRADRDRPKVDVLSRAHRAALHKAFPEIACRSNIREVAEGSLSFQEVLRELQQQHPKLMLEYQCNNADRALTVRVENVFRATIAFPSGYGDNDDKSYEMGRINVLGWNERYADVDDALWCASAFCVFRRLTLVAFSTASHLAASSSSSIHALRRFITWLIQFENLFTASCGGCQRVLMHDSDEFMFVPPTHRAIDDSRPFHPQCYETVKTLRTR